MKHFNLYVAFAAFVFAFGLNAQTPPADPNAVKQEAPATGETKPAEPAADNAGANQLAEAGKFHIGDDPTIWVLILLFNLALAVGIERAWVLYKNRGDNKGLVDLLTARLGSNPQSVDDLITEVSDSKYGMEGRVSAIALRGWKSGDSTIQEFASAAQIAEKRNLERRLVVLSTLGNNTPFIGLLGTVLGIMKAFRDLALMGDAGPAVVMKGISEALVATALGLGVAIPCVIAFNTLGKIVKDKLSSSEEIVSIIRAIRLSMYGDKA